MIISYFQTHDNLKAETLSKRENVYVDLCSSVIPFSKREKGSLLFALVKQKKISKVIVSYHKLVSSTSFNKYYISKKFPFAQTISLALITPVFFSDQL